TSLGETSRSSRSRFRRSPKFPVAMDRTLSCGASATKARPARSSEARWLTAARTLAEGVGSPRRHYRRGREACQTIDRSVVESKRQGAGRVMAIWQRLYYECVAPVFAGSLYLRRFAGVGSSRVTRQA